MPAAEWGPLRDFGNLAFTLRPRAVNVRQSGPRRTIVLIRAITLSLMICYGTVGLVAAGTAFASERPGVHATANLVRHRPVVFRPSVRPRHDFVGPHFFRRHDFVDRDRFFHRHRFHHRDPFFRRHRFHHRDAFFRRHGFFRHDPFFHRRNADFVTSEAFAPSVEALAADPFAGTRASFEAEKLDVTNSWRPGVSTGIEDARPDPYPTQITHRMDLTPTAEFRPGVWELPQVAPPNNCGPRKFEVVNPWYAEERCVGAP